MATGRIPSVQNASTLAGTTLATNVTASSLTSFGATPALTTPTISTATTNGDILYGTGSGALARLGIGSSGQVLNVASGIPAWSTPAASGMNFITRASFSSVATTTTSFDGVFTSTYKNYLIIIESMFAATGGDDLLFQFKYSTSTIDSTANYNGAAAFISRSVAGVALTQTSSGTSMALSNTSGDSSQKNTYALNVERVGNSSEQPAIYGTGASGGGDYGALWIGGGLFANQTYTGFLLKSSSSNITGIVTVYGLAAA